MMTLCTHSDHAKNRGFTLIELLVVIAMSTIVLTAIVGLFSGLARSYTTESARTTIQQDLRAAMDLMTMEIREAGLDPTGDLDSKVSNVTNGFINASNATGPSSIEFIADLNYDGNLDAGEWIRYRLSDDETKLIREVSSSAGSNPKTNNDDYVLLTNVIANTANEPVFVYYDEKNKKTTKIKDIRAVAITLTIEEPAGQDGMITRTLTQRVRVRNSN